MTLTSSTAPETDDRPAGHTDAPDRRAAAVAVGLTLLALLASVAVGVALVVPALLAGVDIESTPAFLALTVAGQLALLAVGVGYARRYGLSVPVARPTRRQTGAVAAGVVAAVVTGVGGALALDALGLLPGSVIADAAADDPAVLLGLAALSVVLIVPVEEFLFRGVIQGRLRRAFGPVGAVLGTLYERTGNLAVPVAVHALYNALLLGAGYLLG